MSEETEYSVAQWLPDDGKRVLAFGHHTLCCKDDMEEKSEWHEVTFSFSVVEYRLKKEIPEDAEESILESYKVNECWDCGTEFLDGFLIGVSKWKEIK